MWGKKHHLNLDSWCHRILPTWSWRLSFNSWKYYLKLLWHKGNNATDPTRTPLNSFLHVVDFPPTFVPEHLFPLLILGKTSSKHFCDDFLETFLRRLSPNPWLYSQRSYITPLKSYKAASLLHEAWRNCQLVWLALFGHCQPRLFRRI